MASTAATPVPYRAEATCDGCELAESHAALRVDVPDAPPLLWFPRADVDAAALARIHTDAWRAGDGDLAGYVAFDHQQVDLILVEGGDHAGGRGPVTRFPNWGDAADLIDVLDVRPDGPLHFTSVSRSDWRRPVVEGSQVLAQSIVAASRRSPGRRAVSSSMVFVRAADARTPYEIELDELSDGRTFTAVGVRAVREGRTCAAGTVLLDVTAPELIRHAEPAPEVPGPDECAPYDMSVTGRDLRVVDAAYDDDPDAPVGPPELAVWVRFRRVPDDQPMHAALLAQFTGHMSIAAALRPHAGIGQAQAHHTISTAINAISLSIHSEVRADRWMLYHHRSTHAGAGMTHSECRVHDLGGAHLASFTVEAMARGFDRPGRGGDERTAL